MITPPKSDKFILLFICLISGVFYSHFWISLGRGYFWDFKVYEEAVSQFSGGNDPYQSSALLFVYHPYVIYFLSALNRLVEIRYIFFVLYAVVSIYALWQLHEFMKICAGLKQKKAPLLLDVAVIIIAAVCFGNAGTLSILSGNVSPFIHLWLLSLVIGHVRKKDRIFPWLFAASVFILSMVKPYFLAYLLFGGIFWNPRTWAATSVAVILMASCLWLSALWFMPDLYNSFETSLHDQILNRNQADLGYSFFGILKPIVNDVKVALALHGAIMIFLYYFLMIWLPKKYVSERAPYLKMLLLVPIVVLSNPRMMGYDFPIAMLAWFVFLYLTDTKHYAKVVLCGVLIALFPIKYYFARKLQILSSSAPAFDDTYWQIIAFSLMLVIHTWNNARSNKMAEV